jgi:hypothetical protein
VDGETLLVTQYESGWLRQRTGRELSYVCPNHGTVGRETDPKTTKVNNVYRISRANRKG